MRPFTIAIAAPATTSTSRRAEPRAGAGATGLAYCARLSISSEVTAVVRSGSPVGGDRAAGERRRVLTAEPFDHARHLLAGRPAGDVGIGVLAAGLRGVVVGGHDRVGARTPRA